MALAEAAAIYYGLQHLAVHPDDLGTDKLYVVRAACIPPQDWSYALWRESV